MSELRKIAAEIAYSAVFGDAQVEPALESVLRHRRPGHAQSEFFRRLVLGAVQRAGTLDAIIEAHSRVAFKEIEPRVLTPLRVGTYEIVFMEQASPYAAIDVMARMASDWSPRAYSFARGMLHGIWKSAGKLVRERPRGTLRRLLQVGKSLWRRFDRDIFPDPQARRAEYLCAVYSLPLWLVEKLLNQYGDRAEKIVAGCIGSAPATMQANLLKGNPGELADTLARQGLSVERGRQKWTFLAREKVDLASVPAYLHGYFIPADEFDVAAVSFLNPRPGERICVLAGSAQTTAQIAQLTAPDGRVTACARSWEEARSVLAEKERLGLDNLDVVAREAGQGPSVLSASFDRVFVEPASTRVGKLRRNAAARWRLKEERLSHLVENQKLALQSAIELCAGGGIAVYVTSSLLQEENDAVIEAVAGRMQHVKVVEREVRFPLPGGPDGGFMAKAAKLSAP